MLLSVVFRVKPQNFIVFHLISLLINLLMGFLKSFFASIIIVFNNFSLINSSEKVLGVHFKGRLIQMFYRILILIHSKPIFRFYTPWKSKKTWGFLLFSRGIEREYWHEMDRGITKLHEKDFQSTCEYLKVLFPQLFYYLN